MRSACKKWNHKRCHNRWNDCGYRSHSYGKCHISATQIRHDIGGYTTRTTAYKDQTKCNSIRKLKYFRQCKCKKWHDQILRDCADTDIKRSLCQNLKIFGCQCQSHAEHDDSDDDRLTGELVGYRINKQWVIYPSHHCRYKECDYCNSDYHQWCIVW